MTFTPDEIIALKALVAPPASVGVEWGEPIEVNGERPSWVTTDFVVPCKTIVGDWYFEGKVPQRLPMDCPSTWRQVSHIRLPADHPYYTATAKGFTYWPGSENAPDDWDEGEIMFRHGGTCSGCSSLDWKRGSEPNPNFEIIGYRKRPSFDREAVANKLTKFAESAKWAGRDEVASWLTHEEVARLVKVLTGNG